MLLLWCVYINIPELCYLITNYPHCKKSGGHIPPNMFPTLGVMSHHDAGGGTLPLYGGIVPLDISVMSHHYEVGGTIPP